MSGEENKSLLTPKSNMNTASLSNRATGTTYKPDIFLQEEAQDAPE